MSQHNAPKYAKIDFDFDFDFDFKILKQSQKIIIWRAQCQWLWRAPGPYGASPTQPYKCGQNLKVKVKISAVFDFNILTALKGWVGHAPQGRGALHIIIFIIWLSRTARRGQAEFRYWANAAFRFNGRACVLSERHEVGIERCPKFLREDSPEFHFGF